MTRLFGDAEAVTTQIGEVTQGIGLEQLPVQESPEPSPTRVLNNEIGSFETMAVQGPTGLGAAGVITINYGAGGSTTGGEFDVSAAGVITTNPASLDIEYRFIVGLRIGRTGGGGISIPLLRFMYAPDGIIGNAVQVGGTFSVEIDDPDTTWREVFDLNFAPVDGSVIFIEMARDEAGNNSGQLQAQQPTGTLSGWNDVATARLQIIRQDLA